MKRNRLTMVIAILTVNAAFPLTNFLAPADSRAFDISSPNYFITGLGGKDAVAKDILRGKNNEARFRINVNFKMVGDTVDNTGLYFGYTQNSFWNILDHGTPNFENNYMPELLFYGDALSAGKDYQWYMPSLLLSLNHQSNGRTESELRSADRFIFTGELGNPVKNGFYASFSFWRFLQISANNPDIANHIGKGELKLNWQFTSTHQTVRGGASLASRFIYDTPLFTNMELDFFLDPFYGLKSDAKWLPTFMAQFFHGRGENLMNYRERVNNLRLGLAFIR